MELAFCKRNRNRPNGNGQIIDEMEIDQIGVDQVGSYPSFIAGDVIISVVEIMFFYNLMEKANSLTPTMI
jgi:hypothetical protein